MNKRLLIIMLLALVVGACGPKQAVRQEEPLPPPPVAAEPVAAAPAEELKLPDIGPVKEGKEDKKPQKAAEKKQDEQFVMLNFENADIETVISTVSEMLKINYILTPGVAGKITIQSHNKIPISELYSTFQTVLELNGFTAVKEGSFYRIVPIDTAKQQPVAIQSGKKIEFPKDSSFVTQEIPLEFVKANDVANMLKNLMPRGTDIVVYEPSNMLIVTAPPSGLVKFMKLLDAIDIPSTERDSIKTFVYHVENGEAKKLADIIRNLYAKKGTGAPAPAVKTVAPTPATPAPVRAPVPGRPQPAQPQPSAGAAVLEGVAGEIEGEVVIEAYDDINALLIKSSPRAYLTLLETIKRLDIQPKQVLIEVMVAEISLNDQTKLGIEWLLKTSLHVEGQDYDVFGGFNGGNGLQYDTDLGRFVLPAAENIALIPTGGFARILDPKRFTMFIQAAAQTGNVNVLASPHILALDNKEAKIEVGSEVPVATSVTQAGVDSTVIGNTTSQVQFKSVGTILTVTPHINEKKQVTLKVAQEVSEIGDTVKIGSQDYTGFNTRKANTTAIVQDGHTLVIGGIIQERTRQARAGIPFLSSIPVLGYLFGTTTDETAKRELIILITPHVVSDKEEADALTEEVKNRIKDIKRKLEEKQSQFKQSRIIPDNTMSSFEQ
jgi:general secretion pathway protein D